MTSKRGENAERVEKARDFFCWTLVLPRELKPTNVKDPGIVIGPSPN